MLSEHIVLVGLSGAGKSTMATRLARLLGRSAIDTDRMVERRAGATVAIVFAREGEAAFRRLERMALLDALSGPPSVIATGGGAVTDPDSRRVLAAASGVVWLRADPDDLVGRVAVAREVRPLLADDAAAALHRLDVERSPLYAEVADIVVDTTGRTPAEVLDAVLEALDASDRSADVRRDVSDRTAGPPTGSTR